MKTFKLLASAALAASLLAGCSSSTADDQKTDGNDSAELTTIKVGATTTPHAVRLREAVEPMKEAGYNLEIVEYSDYPNINPSTSDGSLDANYFQHEPYLLSYDADNGYESGDDGYLVAVAKLHYEPLGLYSDKYTSVDELPDGAIIAVPNDATNEARALLLLQDLGLLTLEEDADLNTATKASIKDNPHNIDIQELNADQIPSKLPDVDYAIVNGNFALSSDILDKMITQEAVESDALTTYVNVLAAKESRKDDPAIQKLVEIMKSDKLKDFMASEFGDTVIQAK